MMRLLILLSLVISTGVSSFTMASNSIRENDRFLSQPKSNNTQI